MDQPEPQPLVGLRILLCQLECHRVQVLCSLLGCHAGFEPSEHRHRGSCPVRQVVPSFHRCLVDHGNPVVRPDELLGAVERCRSHANHGERCLVELHGGADHARVGLELAPPQSVAQDDIRRGVRTVLIHLVVQPAQLRPHSQQVEVICRDFDARYISHRALPGQSRAGVAVVASDSSEGSAALLEVTQRRVRGGQQPSLRPNLMADLVEVRRITDRQ